MNHFDRGINYTEFVSKIYERANRRTIGWLAVLVRALSSFSRKRASIAAAGITYYSIFSIFPLLVFTITALKPFISLPIVEDILKNYLERTFPISIAFLLEEVDVLMATRGSINVIALFGFLWAASGMFNAILININYAWGIDSARSRLKSRLFALAFATILAVLIVLLLIVLWILKILAGLLLTFWERILVLSLPLLIQLGINYLFYKAGPATKVGGRSAIIAACFSSVGMELVSWGFTWYLNSEWSTYAILYGSLGAIIGLLFWVYLNNLIILFGAYLSEAIQARSMSENPALFFEPLLLTIG